jgi:hypothetical protein
LLSLFDGSSVTQIAKEKNQWAKCKNIYKNIEASRKPTFPDHWKHLTKKPIFVATLASFSPLSSIAFQL